MTSEFYSYPNPTKLDSFTLERARNEARTHAQGFSNSELADRLFAMANEPRRFDAIEKYGLLYTAGARLRRTGS